MKNIIFIFVSFLMISPAYSQTKKEQIASFKSDIDSLNQVIFKNEKIFQDQLELSRKVSEDLTKQNQSLIDSIKLLSSKISEHQTSISYLEKDKSKVTLENEKFKADLEEFNRKNNIEISKKPFRINEGDYAGETRELDVVKIKNNTKLEATINEEIFLRFNLLQSSKFDPILGFEKYVGSANIEFRKISTLWYFYSYGIYAFGEGKFIIEYFGPDFELIRYFLSIDDDVFELNFDGRFLDDPEGEH
jgi:hypothetical protein